VHKGRGRRADKSVDDVAILHEQDRRRRPGAAMLGFPASTSLQASPSDTRTPLEPEVGSRQPVLLFQQAHWSATYACPGEGLIVVGRGRGSADVALTWLLMTAAEIPGGGSALIGKALRTLFVRSFLAHFDLGSVRTDLSSVAKWKCRDQNMRPAEVAAMRRLVERQSRRP